MYLAHFGGDSASALPFSHDKRHTLRLKTLIPAQKTWKAQSVTIWIQVQTPVAPHQG
jgi:hypothetical protein